MQTATRYAALTGVAVLFGLLAIGWLSQTEQAPEQKTVVVHQIDGTGGDQQIEERVIDLPEDAGMWHTILVYYSNPPTDPASRRLKAMFAATPRLQSLVAQTKKFEYSVNDRLYRLRYSKLMGGMTPQVWLQTDKGRVVYKASGNNVPVTGEALADEIQQQIATRWPCPPKPQPVPVPVPVPGPVPGPPVIPDIRPVEPDPAEPDPVNESVPLFAGIGLVVLAGLAGLYVEWQKSKP